MFSTMVSSKNILCIFPGIGGLSKGMSGFLYDMIFKVFQCLSVYMIKNFLKQKNIRFISIWMCLFKLQGPIILVNICQNLMFQTIDGQRYVYNDYSIVWGSNRYVQNNLFVLIPFLVFLVVILPVFLYYQTCKYLRLRPNFGKDQYRDLRQSPQDFMDLYLSIT